MSHETEAKFTVSDLASFDRLKSLPELAGFSLGPSEERSVLDHYLDTPRRAFVAAGWAVRLRWTGGYVLVTAKRMSAPSGALHEREELELTLTGAFPPSEWPEGRARDLVLSVKGDEELGLLFELRQERTVREVTCGGRVIAEMSLDHVSVSAGGGRKELRELEIELRPDGSREELLAMMAALQKDASLVPSPRSKFEEGLLLLDGGPVLPSAGVAPRRRTSRAPAPRARTWLVLEAPEGVTAEAVFAELSRLGYRFRVRSRKEESRRYMDTRAGSLFKQHAELYFESRRLRWHLLRDALPSCEQKGSAESPPAAGELASSLREITSANPGIAFLDALVNETVINVGSITGPGVGMALRAWRLSSLLHDSAPQTAVTVAFEKKGAAAFAVDYLARLLSEALGLRQQNRTELAFGLSRLDVPFPGAPLPAQFLPARGDDAAAVCAKVLGGEAWRMKANTSGAVRDLDPEFVHDLRVATRRARFACRLFADVQGEERSRSVRTELSWIAGLLGGVRDLDVLRARIESQLGRIEADTAFQAGVFRTLEKRTLSARQELAPALTSTRYEALLALMAQPAERADVGDPAETFARRRIGKALAKIAPWTHTDPDSLTAEQLHRLRILFKRLRYTVEFFRPILGPGAALLARECVAFQDCLGLHQDARVAAGVLAGLADEPAVREHSTGLMALGALIQVQRETMRLQRERFRTLWGAVESLFDLWKTPPRKGHP